MTTIIDSLAEVSDRYDVLYCDLWGCLHDGYTPYPEAVAALRAFRDKGGFVLLLTNSPRPRADVERQIGRIGVPRDCWDSIASSGDSARAAMFRGHVGRKVWFIGQPQDEGFFAPIQVVDDPVEIARVPLEEAEGIVCTGPEDPFADPAAMRPAFLHAKTRGLKLLCANPDIVVDRGDTREWCAGALAQLYTEMGGESLYFGKPHAPIYELARMRLAAGRRGLPDGPHPCRGRRAAHGHPRRAGRRDRLALRHRRPVARGDRHHPAARPGQAGRDARRRAGRGDMVHRLPALERSQHSCDI